MASAPGALAGAELLGSDAPKWAAWVQMLACDFANGVPGPTMTKAQFEPRCRIRDILLQTPLAKEVATSLFGSDLDSYLVPWLIETLPASGWTLEAVKEAACGVLELQPPQGLYVADELPSAPELGALPHECASLLRVPDTDPDLARFRGAVSIRRVLDVLVPPDAPADGAVRRLVFKLVRSTLLMERCARLHST